MTRADLARLRELAAKATPTDGRADIAWTMTPAMLTENALGRVWGPDGDQIAAVFGNLALGGDEDDNAAFIAASREAVPALCDALEEAVRIIQRLEGACLPCEPYGTHRDDCDIAAFLRRHA